jgi:uncharacterized OB-fold protein
VQQQAGNRSIDPLFLPFLTGQGESKLRFPHCRSASIEWTEVAGTATVFTWTEVHHAFDRDFELKPPYLVALIEFSDAPGIRLVTNIVGETATGIAIGQKISPQFGERNGVPYVQFKPALS